MPRQVNRYVKLVDPPWIYVVANIVMLNIVMSKHFAVKIIEKNAIEKQQKNIFLSSNSRRN